MDPTLFAAHSEPLADNIIAFVIVKNNESSYQESLKHIATMDIPNGYTVNIITVINARSLAAAYNSAMCSSKARYKVYMHQDVLLLNRFFLHDVIRIFSSNAFVGMIGVCGCSKLPPSGVWWEADVKYGKVLEYRGVFRDLSFSEVNNDVQFVEAIDGLLMVTQYDLPWREDLFNGFHFYDTSQCLEFRKAGLYVAIPRQMTPWCIHYKDENYQLSINEYNTARMIFLSNYSYVTSNLQTIKTSI